MAKKQQKKRNDRLVVAVNSDERREFTRLAEHRHTNVAQLIRELLYSQVETMKARKAVEGLRKAG